MLRIFLFSQSASKLKLSNLWINPNRIKLTFSNLFQVHHAKLKSSDAWRQLKIEAMKKQFEMANNYQDLKSFFSAEKVQVIDLINSFVDFVDLHEDAIVEELMIVQMTPELLKKQLVALRKTIEQQEYNLSIASMLIQFYRRLHQYKIESHKNYLFNLTVILEFVIKTQYFLLFLNKIDDQSNILNSHPKDFEQVWKRIKLIPLNQNKLEKDYQRLRLIMHTSIGILLQETLFQRSSIFQFLKIPFVLVGKVANYKRQMFQSLIVFRNPTAQIIKHLNTLQEGKNRRIMELNFKSIKTNKMIYIPRGEFPRNLDIFKEDKSAIPVRILYNRDLPTSAQGGKQIEEAFFHIHGGGFLLFTSFISQNYTRYWAKESNILLFSIDYKLAPEDPFPSAVNDCFHAYCFIRDQLHKYLKINLKRVFVGGDSAGGSLSCALTALLLQKNIRLPNSLLLIYPSLDVRKVFYPSKLHSFSDFMLWPSLMNLCMDTYLKRRSDQDNPLASPILLTQQFIGGEKGDRSFPKQWPKTYIMVGTKDPLRDQSLLLMQRMTEAGVECKCQLYQGLNHAFMSTENLISQSQIPYQHSVEIINEMIQESRR